MTQAVPVLSQIDAAVHTLASAGRFERLVGEILRIEWPDRFADLGDFGTNLDQRTRAGWPDLVAIRSDGRIDAVEVTYGITQWQRHLNEDIEKLKRFDAGSIATFTFVSWSSRPEIAQLLTYIADLDDAGLSPGRVRFLFREDIVQILSNARFARIWQDPLQLQASPWPFQIIQDVSSLFGSDTSPARFKPTRDDFRLGRVHLPPLFGVVKAALLEKRIAVLTGRGASGKTVFATALAFETEFANLPIFYLDLDEPTGTLPSALETLTMYGSEATLFIIDNAHLDLRFAEQIYRHCRQTANDSRLLLVRRASSRLVDDGSEEPLSELNEVTYELVVETTDIEGVYRRLMERFYDSAAAPPINALREWGASFSGDLAVFSAAVVNRNQALSRSQWHLNYADAAELVNDRYLRHASAFDRRELTAIAIVSVYEAALPWAPGKDPALPEEFIRSGIVILSRASDGIRRRFAHPSIGSLVLAIVGIEHREDALQDIVNRDPSVAIRIAMRAIAARTDGRPSDEQTSAALLRSLLTSNEAFARVIANPTAIPAIASSFRAAGVLDFAAFDDLTAKNYDHIRAAISAPGLVMLASFCDFAARYLPRCYQLLGKDLSNATFVDALLLKYLRRSPQNLPALIGVLQKWSPGVAKYLQERIAVCIDAAAESIAGDLSAGSGFLRFIHGSMPKTYKTLRLAIIERPEVLNAFVTSIARAGLDHLSAMLSFLHDFDTDLYRRSVVRLFRKFRPEIAESVVRTPLPQLSVAVAFMHEHLRTFHDHIVQLVTSDYAEAVALKARTSPLGEIVSFIESHPPSLDPIAAAVLKDLRRPETMADLGVRVGRAPLHDVRGFIFMARQRMPEICNDLIDRLREPAALDTISGRIAADPNEHFIGFIRMMEERDQTFGGKLLNRLAEESLVLVLARRLFDAPIHTVVQFLQYFGRESPNLRQRLVTAMGDVGNQILTVRSFYRSNTLHWLLSECSMVQTSPEDKYAELARELRGEPREYIYLARAFEACLPNLAKYAASVVMLGGSEARWRRAYLEEVLHCVRIASDLPEMNRHHFLSRVARRSWLREQFTAAEPGPLARVTFLLWITLKFPERRIFINEFLVKALNNTFARSLASAAVAIPLLASAKLLHVDLKVLPGSWHSDVEINAALDELIGNEDSSQTRLSFKLAAFWVGLKVLTRMRKVAIQIAPRSGTETLQRWLAAKPETDRVEQFNSVMIGWLTMCAENQWRLTIDSEPFDP